MSANLKQLVPLLIIVMIYVAAIALIIWACALFFIKLPGCQKEPSIGKIVFTSSRDGNLEIYAMNGDGTDQRRITHNPANDTGPSWSSNGETILFASDRDGFWNIYTVQEDGTNVKQLTTGGGSNTSPSWAVNDTKILFVSSRDAVNGDLYLMNDDGSNVERLTNDAMVKDTPVMTPAGDHILVTMNDKERLSIGSFSLSSKTMTLLTSPEHQSLYISISRDGSKVLYISAKDGNYEVYSMRIDGREQTRITSNTSDDFTPSWGRGTEEVMYSKKGGIYLLSLTSGVEKMLSNKGDTAPNWCEN